MAVLIDLSDQTGITEASEGDTATRKAVVTGVTGSGSTYLQNALDTVGVPDIGDAHPVKSGLKVIDRTARDQGCGKVAILINYAASSGLSTFQAEAAPTGNDAGEVKHVTFSVVTVQATKDAAGADIVVVPPDGTVGTTDFSAAKDQIKKINKDIVVGRIRFERNELDFPGARMRTFINKLNSGTEGPYAAETLRCVAIDAKSPNDGDWYNVTYEFMYRSDGHGVEVSWELQGGVQPDAHTAASRKTVAVYESTSYTSLSLGFSD